MTANCRCYCGCERSDRQLNNETSSDLTCRMCLHDRHLVEHPQLTERVVELEFAVRQMQALAGVAIGNRIRRWPTTGFRGDPQ